MNISELNLQYVGFQPSEASREYLESHMEELYSESPRGANLQAAFSRQGPMFKGRVRIDSSGGHFFATATGRQMKNVVHKLMLQIRKQLGKWKDSHLQRQKIYEVPFKSLEYGDIKSAGA